MDFANARRLMIERQLQKRGITDPRVLEAFNQVPREQFVLPKCTHLAYEDRALPIEDGQTISQPYIVGLMTQALELTGDEIVLEVGTGSGYQAAVLSYLCRQVVSIERHADLARQALQRLQALGRENVTVVVGDGTLGCEAYAPYDRIIVTATGPKLSEVLFGQLKEGGIVVAPIGDANYEMLYSIRKCEGKPLASDLCACRFVPLVGAEGFPERNSGEERDYGV